MANAPSPTTAEPVPALPDAPGLDLSFDDTRNAFAYKTTAELRRGRLLFQSIQYPWLVSLGPRLVNFGLRNGLPIRGLLRRYFFDQFCGGTTLTEAENTIRKLAQSHVKTVLDYAVEGEKTEAGFDAVLAELVRVLEFGQQHQAVAFVASKLTGLGSSDIFTKLQASQALTAEEQQRHERFLQRVETLCQRAHDLGQPLYIDAEETWFQDVVDDVCEAMIVRFNRERPIVYTTIQFYRHDRLAYLQAFAERMAQAGAIPAVKIVRGAYIEKENARAAEKGYPTPMQPTKQATDDDFNRGLVYILERIDRFGLCIGSHNEYSCRLAAHWLEAHGLPRNHAHVYFSQLYGMSDHLSFNLAAAGFNVAKYLPYGPLEAAVPYLFRRAQENSSVNTQSNRELDLIRRELARRG
jgi:proline dehydrogenase